MMMSGLKLKLQTQFVMWGWSYHFNLIQREKRLRRGSSIGVRWFKETRASYMIEVYPDLSLLADVMILPQART